MPFLLVALFILVPIAELAVIIQVGQAIGVCCRRSGLLILDSVLGAALMRSQGRAAWRRFNTALRRRAACPVARSLDGALVIVGGALLLTPGFISDILGLLFLLPPTRAAHPAAGPPLRIAGMRRAARARPRGPRPAAPAAATTSTARPRRSPARWTAWAPPCRAPPPARDARVPGRGDVRFGDPAAKLYGLARLGLSRTAARQRAPLLFAGREPVAALAARRAGGPEEPAGASAPRGLRATIDEPLRRWKVPSSPDGQASTSRFRRSARPPSSGGDAPGAPAAWPATSSRAGERQSARRARDAATASASAGMRGATPTGSASSWRAPSRRGRRRPRRRAHRRAPGGAAGHDDEATAAASASRRARAEVADAAPVDDL